MVDIDALAERVWPLHELTDEDQRQKNIEKWKKAVVYLGHRWIALPMNTKQGVAA